MICCRINTFPSQTPLDTCRSPTSTLSDDLLILQAIRYVATAPGECLIVGYFNDPDVDWSNGTGPNHPTHTCPDWEPVVGVGPIAALLIPSDMMGIRVFTPCLARNAHRSPVFF